MNFKEQKRISTTLSPELQLLAHKKNIKWSEALAYGVQGLANINIPLKSNETIEKETESSRIQQMQMSLNAMQERILELQKEDQK